MNTSKFFIALLLCGMGFNLLAQPHDFKRIESLKTKYITDELDLNPEEAQKFWPIYNSYRKDLDAIHDRRQAEFKRAEMARNWEEKSDEEIWEFTKQELEDQKKIAEVKREYLDRFAQAVGQRKAASYYRLEVQFHRRLMQELGKRRRPRP